MGPQTTAAMFLGALVGWAFLSPLSHHMGWTNGIPMDAEEGSKGELLCTSVGPNDGTRLVLTFASIKPGFSGLALPL